MYFVNVFSWVNDEMFCLLLITSWSVNAVMRVSYTTYSVSCCWPQRDVLWWNNEGKGLFLWSNTIIAGSTWENERITLNSVEVQSTMFNWPLIVSYWSCTLWRIGFVQCLCVFSYFCGWPYWKFFLRSFPFWCKMYERKYLNELCNMIY